MQVKKIGVEALVLVPDGQVSGAVDNSIKLLIKNDGELIVVAPWTIYNIKTLQLANNADKIFKRLILLSPWHREMNISFSDFANHLWFGQINSRTALAYDAAYALVKAFEMQSSPPTREGTLKSLSSEDFYVLWGDRHNSV